MARRRPAAPRLLTSLMWVLVEWPRAATRAAARRAGGAAGARPREQQRERQARQAQQGERQAGRRGRRSRQQVTPADSFDTRAGTGGAAPRALGRPPARVRRVAQAGAARCRGAASRPERDRRQSERHVSPSPNGRGVGYGGRLPSSVGLAGRRRVGKRRQLASSVGLAGRRRAIHAVDFRGARGGGGGGPLQRTLSAAAEARRRTILCRVG